MMCWLQEKVEMVRVIILLISFLFSLQVGAIDVVTPQFVCSSTMQNQYGVCSHITMMGDRWNYNTHEKELKILKDINSRWVRSDLVVYNLMPNPGEWTPSVYDQIFKHVNKEGIYYLPILSSSYKGQFAWEGDWYNKYIQIVADKYAKQFPYWEVMNEIDLVMNSNPTRNVPAGYLSALQTSYTYLKKSNPNVKVLSTSFCDMRLSLLDYLCQNNGYNYWDIFNFHSYAQPEQLHTQFSALKKRMDQYGWNKPVWMTECGSSSGSLLDEQTCKNFYKDFLPVALRLINIDIKKTEIGVLTDPQLGYIAITEDEVDLYLKEECRKVRYISFQGIKNLSIAKNPVLIVSQVESFPMSKFNIILEYVKNGGTIVLAGGAPFYYDIRNITYKSSEKTQVGDRYYASLHIAALFPWTNKAKQLNAPEIPLDCKNQYSSYKWNFSVNSQARYMTDDNLRGNDKLIPIIEAGNQEYKGCVAGVYKLDSDLHGNVIFQTRMDFSTPLSEKEQAKRVPRIHLISFANGVDKVFMYNLRSSELSQNDKESHFGLLHKDLSPKPAFLAYKTLINMCPSGSERPKITVTDGVYAAVWKKADGKNVIALWTSVGFKNAKLVSTQKIKRIDYLGRSIASKDDVIYISSEVQYFESSHPLHYENNTLK